MRDKIHSLKSIKLIFQAFYSQEAYQHVFSGLKGRGIKYIIFLSFIISLVVAFISYQLSSNFNDDLRDSLKYENAIDANYSLEQNFNNYLSFVADLPNVQIENKTFKIDPEEYKLATPFENNSLYFNSLLEYPEITQNDSSLIFAKDAIMLNRSDNLVVLKLSQLIDNLHAQKRITLIDINYTLDLIGKFPQIQIIDGKITSDLDDQLIKDIYDKNKIYVNTNKNYFNLKSDDFILVVLANGVYLKRTSISNFLLNFNTSDNKTENDTYDEKYHFIRLEDINENNIRKFITNIVSLTNLFDNFTFFISFIYIFLTHAANAILTCYVASFFCRYFLQHFNAIYLNKNDTQRLLSFAYLPIMTYEIFFTLIFPGHDFFKLIVLSVIYGYYIYLALKSTLYLSHNHKN